MGRAKQRNRKGSKRRPKRARWSWKWLVGGAAIAILAGLIVWRTRSRPPPVPPEADQDSALTARSHTTPPSTVAALVAWFPAGLDTAGYAGAAACADCHRDVYDRWRKSPHGRAMAVPTAASVLGRFDGTEVTLDDGSVVPGRSGDAYIMELERGATSERHRVDLVLASGRQHQLYLTKMPDGGNRILPIWWSTVSNRWLPLDLVGRGDALDPTSARHWSQSPVMDTKCFTCHVSRARHHVSAQTIETSFGDLAIDCESCHGPAREHVERRKAGSEGGRMRSLSGLDNVAEGTLCAQCHALKFAGRFAEDDHGIPEYMPATLAIDSLRPDGTQDMTSYQYAGHALSSCYRKGAMKCSSCHDPHLQNARNLLGESAQGAHSDRQCTVCHRDRIDGVVARAHSHHAESIRCIDCHMSYSWLTDRPEVEQRTADHSISIPRPREALEFGVPNACTSCHAGREPSWAVAALEGWGQLEATQIRPWLQAVVRARRKEPGAVPELLAILADDASGDYLTLSALDLLASQPPEPAAVVALRPYAQTKDAHRRALAINALAVHDIAGRATWVRRGLDDPHPFVRLRMFFSDVASDERSEQAIEHAIADLLATGPSPAVQEITELAKRHWDAGRKDRALEVVELARSLANPQQVARLDALRDGLIQRGAERR